MKLKRGFTIAEVLITLSILGIVAVMTIPAVINRYERRVTITKVKKMYNTLTKAYTMALSFNNMQSFYINEQIYDGASAYGAAKVYEDFVKPYFKISFDAGTNTNRKKRIMSDEIMKALNGQTHTINYCTNPQYYAVQLVDGSVLWFRGARPMDGYNKALLFWYDTNGKKGPNTLGRDIFVFSIKDQANEVYPWNETTTSYDQALRGCISENSGGWTCAAWIIAKGNMDYLDCPEKLSLDKSTCR